MKIISFLLILFVFTGCASMGGGYDAKPRVEIANQIFKDEFTYFQVNSSGAIADAAFIAMAKSSGPSDMAVDLVNKIKFYQNTGLKLLVTGPNNSKSAIVLKNAFKLLQGKDLSKIQIVFIGDKLDEYDVKQLVEQTGATFYFRQSM